jgi:RHS repeat-associated protein
MELLSYFYHPNHTSTWLSTGLGSSASTRLSNLWITDGSGQAIQHLHYLPFGEEWIDQKSTSWNAPYTFTGKIKDAETGYNYFGARYYDSQLSVWLSVDPLSDKYPSMSPYTYCANNPIMMVDPDGERIIIVLPNLRLEFKNGKLYNTTDNNLYSGDNQFARSVEKGLNQIHNKSLLGKVMVEVLEQLDYDVNINSTSQNPKENPIPKSATEIGRIEINLNPEGYPGYVREKNGNDVIKKDFVADMGHELSHAFLDAMGMNKNYVYYFDNMKGTEWIACYMENIIRQHLGKNYRSYYQGIQYDSETETYSRREDSPCLLNRRDKLRTDFFNR